MLLTSQIVDLNGETSRQTQQIALFSQEANYQTAEIEKMNVKAAKQGKTIMFFTIITIIFVSFEAYFRRARVLYQIH